MYAIRSYYENSINTYNIRLNKEQRSEVESLFDSYTNFKKSVKGELKLSENGTWLDNIWNEITEKSAGMLDVDEPVGNQPIALAEALHALKPSMTNSYGMDNTMLAYDMALNIYKEYFSALV